MDEFLSIMNLDIIETTELVQVIAAKTKRMKQQYPTLPNEAAELRRCALDSMSLAMALVELVSRQNATLMALTQSMEKEVTKRAHH